MPDINDTLLHVGDLHFWKVIRNPLVLLNKRFLGNLNVMLKRRREFPMEQAERFTDTLAATKCPTAVFTGDFTSTATDEEFALARAFIEGVRSRGITPLVMPGNHDRYTFRSARERVFESHFAGFAPEQGYPCCERLPGGTPVVLVPTVCPNVLSSRGHARVVDIDRLHSILARLDEPTIVAAHYPVLTKTPEYCLTHNRNLRNRRVLRELLGEQKYPILYLCGHTHRFSYVQDDRFSHLRHLCAGAFFRVNEREGIRGDFCEVHAAGGAGDRFPFRAYRHTFNTAWMREAAHPREL